ncbi:MAG: dihydroneopterin aldolase [Chloroflexi bacterium]|nr:dihydroneopterin aldolase [Chloroflexota bacterium]
MSSHPDRISLIGMRFEARHGVHAEEKRVPQPFEVDVVVHADLAEAVDRDDLAATVDYGALHELVSAIVTGPSFDLIEALAGAIARAVLAATDAAQVGSVEVRVRKPKAPLDGAFETVEAAVVRHRPDGG